jgi:ABC-2 type transport system permease protein
MIPASFHRIWAITLRYLHQSLRDLLMIADFIYWPLIDIVIWGMMSVWLQNSGTGESNIIITLVSGLVLWQIVYQANIDIANNLIEEVWSQNLVNIFSTPLTINEWIGAVMLLGTIRMFIILLFGSFIAWLFYALKIFTLGWALIPFVISLLLTGWALGFFTAGFILYGGVRVHWATWAIGQFLSPFISIYYPTSTLPKWGQIIAYALPPTYVFEGMRKVIETQMIPYYYLFISLLLNAFYLSLSVMYFKAMFEKSRAMGLSRSE